MVIMVNNGKYIIVNFNKIVVVMEFVVLLV